MIGVVAMNRDRCIGRDGSIPWRHREDLAFFKRLTVGGTLVMGRKTWDSLPKKPLPRRDHVVLTRDPAGAGSYERTVFTDVEGLDEALRELSRPVYVIGGAQVYALLRDRIDEWYVTEVTDDVPDCDTVLPFDPRDGLAVTGVEPLSDACAVHHAVRV